jgi:hypothetical protein
MTNKMQLCSIIYYSIIPWLLNMFRAILSLINGASKLQLQLLVLLTFVVAGRCHVPLSHDSGRQRKTRVKLEAVHLLPSRLLWHTEQPVENGTSQHPKSGPPVVQLLEATCLRSASLSTTGSNRIFNRLPICRSVASMSLHRVLKAPGDVNVHEEILVLKHLVLRENDSRVLSSIYSTWLSFWPASAAWQLI